MIDKFQKKKYANQNFAIIDLFKRMWKKKYIRFVKIINLLTKFVHRDELCHAVFAARQKQNKKYANSVYSKQAVDAAFKKLNDSDLLKVCPEPPSTPSEVITFATIQCQQAPLYIAGRWIPFTYCHMFVVL